MVSETYAKGLEGVIAAESVICRIDGAKGNLYYRGYSIEDLAKHCSYEEVTYLLLYGDLPTPNQLKEFTHKMRSSRALSRQYWILFALFLLLHIPWNFSSL